MARIKIYPMERDDFYYPKSASPRYTIIAIDMFEGRTIEAKKALICLLFERMKESVRAAAQRDRSYGHGSSPAQLGFPWNAWR